MRSARATFDGRQARRFAEPVVEESGAKTVVVKVVMSESGQLTSPLRVPVPPLRPLKAEKEKPTKRHYVSSNNWIVRVVKAQERKERRFFFKAQTTTNEIVDSLSTNTFAGLKEERLGRKTLLGGGPKVEGPKKVGRPKKRKSNNASGKKKSSLQQEDFSGIFIFLFCFL